MEYVVSFLTFFMIYFSITYMFRGIKGKSNIKESESNNQKGKGKNKSSNNTNQNTKQKDNSEFYRILKNSLMISFVYIIIILIFRFFK
ncbi:hypothetical protein [Proteiniborus sp. MB09-C3]|uniref:hypothetical protein n=1 Tax=Proteiniborus sp. MB09-C3 TaxID=3050072 RepID=UPI002555F4B2|nr:hypothetical protein [Proteiniborus sp. MB09-C3]WIV11403.1 hypothetical protein QO263_15060 [Proteiniborus sp. MB09-C3]